jgi:hypothetical protein
VEKKLTQITKEDMMHASRILQKEKLNEKQKRDTNISNLRLCMRTGNERACARWKMRQQQEQNIKKKKLAHKGLVRVGQVNMDTASLLISDPSYVLHRNPLPRAFGRNYQNFVRDTTTGKKHGRQLNAGLGVIVFSGGDGTADVYVKPDRYGGITEARIIF